MVCANQLPKGTAALPTVVDLIAFGAEFFRRRDFFEQKFFTGAGCKVAAPPRIDHDNVVGRIVDIAAGQIIVDRASLFVAVIVQYDGVTVALILFARNDFRRRYPPGAGDDAAVLVIFKLEVEQLHVAAFGGWRSLLQNHKSGGIVVIHIEQVAGGRTGRRRIFKDLIAGIVGAAEKFNGQPVGQGVGGNQRVGGVVDRTVGHAVFPKSEPFAVGPVYVWNDGGGQKVANRQSRNFRVNYIFTAQPEFFFRFGHFQRDRHVFWFIQVAGNGFCGYSGYFIFRVIASGLIVAHKTDINCS